MRTLPILLVFAFAAALLAGSAWAQAPESAPAPGAGSHAVSPEPKRAAAQMNGTLWWTETGSALLALRAEPSKLPRLRLYGGSQAFTAEAGHTHANLEIGAGVRVLRRARLTASYRMLGFDLTSSVGQFDSDVAAPFLGLALDF